MSSTATPRGAGAAEPAPAIDGLPRTAYAEHTWLELRELAGRDDVVIVIPTATLEDHGYHLPIDTDVRLVEAIARGAMERVNASGGDAVAMLFPTAVHGYTPHHMDFPGTVTLRWNVFVESLLDCGRSLCHHGFDRILLLNGHGSNAPLVDMAARLINVEHRGAGFLRAHLGPYLGGFAAVHPLVSDGRSGFVATAQECQCHLANPAYLAAVTRGGTVTWLEINGPGATRPMLATLLARAP